jgi:hypothetical protein
MASTIEELDPALQEELRKRRAAGKKSLVISQGRTLVSPNEDPAYLEPLDAAISQTPPELRDQMISAEKIRADRQYQDELDSAERLRREQERDQYFDRGLRPPAFTSEFSPPTSGELRMQRPQFLKSGNDWYQVDPGNVPRMVVNGPEGFQRPAPIVDIDSTKDIPLPEGFVWAWTPSGYVQRAAPRKSDYELMMGGDSPPAGAAAPAAASSGSIRSFNSEADARRAGVRPGERIRIIGQGIGYLE